MRYKNSGVFREEVKEFPWHKHFVLLYFVPSWLLHVHFHALRFCLPLGFRGSMMLYVNHYVYSYCELKIWAFLAYIIGVYEALELRDGGSDYMGRVC